MQFKEHQTEQKLRGGYYTPLELAIFISKWVTNQDWVKSILEPSCGDGVFFEAIYKSCRRHIKIEAFEIEKEEATKAKQRSSVYKNLKINMQVCNFLEWASTPLFNGELFDGVVGNPPFIRYQYLPPEAQEMAEKVFLQYGLPFTRHTNAWVPFVVAAIGALKPGGRLGMVVPAEILHVMHAQAVRNFLGVNCKRMLIFDPEDLWFEKTLQGAVILLAEKKYSQNEKSMGLGIIRTVGKDFLKKKPEEYFDAANFINGRTVEGKWTRALLSKKEIELFERIEEHERVFPFGQIANVDVGLVTGANSFFLVPDEVVKQHNLDIWAHPMFGRSEHCPGVIYDRKQHESNSRMGLPTNFLWFNVNKVSELSSMAKEYIAKGEKQDLHRRYKCRIREPWFKVPSVYTSQIGMLKRAHDIPRLILNELRAYTTDTAYRITASQIQAERLVYYFINSLTALSAELEGRYYGGGVLELVPSEIEKLKIPIPQNGNIRLYELDERIKTRHREEVLKEQDKIILGRIGLTKNEQDVLFEGWNRLRRRRQRVSSECSD